ncbi:MAG TPA: beta-ketoacyl synthase N-terminal-like domain-containing protein [Ktedonobacteraceae bacterium]|nr:beta-ketoacyl synthase N-terminal-like domain-containing protein [Ktedonobacteraceae bacterium]
MTNSTHRRAVITGLGVVAPNGIGKEAFWQATSKGISGIKPISRISTAGLPISVAGEVTDFMVTNYMDRKLARNTDRMTHLAFAAAQEALQDANIVLEEEDPRCVGAVIANTLGGIEYVLEQFQEFFIRGPRYVSPHTAIAWLQVANVGQMSIRYGIQGYSKTPVNDTVGGLDAMGMAYSAIRRGTADVIIAGGSEAFLQPEVMLVMARGGQCVIGDDPHAYRPFDRRANGLLLAEGAGMCIVEEYEHARRRGASIYGEIVGYGQSNDANGYRMPIVDGAQYARAMRLALQEGHLSPSDIGYFNLDGRATPIADQSEAEALYLVFESRLAQVPVSVPRTMLGHSFAAAGALDTITVLLSLQHNLIPPTINCEELDPRYELNLVRKEARPLSGSAALVGGRSMGGANVILALRRA